MERMVGFERRRLLKTEENIRIVEEMIRHDDGISCRAISEVTGSPKLTIFEIIQEDMCLVSKIARLMPHSPTDQQQKQSSAVLPVPIEQYSLQAWHVRTIISL